MSNQPIFLTNKRFLIASAVFGMLLLALFVRPADAAVELVYFRGSFSEAPATVELEWKTSYESRTAGYFIKRKVSGSDDPATTISITLNGAETNFIPAAEDGITGADYAVADSSVVPGESYEYSLWEQEFDSNEPTQPEKVLEISAEAESVSSELANPTEAPPTAASATGAAATNTPTSSSATAATATATATVVLPATSTPAGSSSAATVTPTATATPVSVNAPENDPTPTPIVAVSDPDLPDAEEGAPSLQPTVPLGITPRAGESGSAEASELPQDETYPDPATGAEDGEANPENYVPPLQSTAVPISEQQIQPIGEGVEIPEDPNNLGGQAIEQIDPDEISRNRLILWGGFLASLLFFVAVVVGTILMYRQRNTGG